ncbi:FAD-dependent oxidoreductase [Archangium lipolyticum]|uniref:FAD-dependent oxidoreductase n=1 Tax=Archangium lipolyticum TaxID=2970465 RepID=UPI002149FBF6|nr:FAD-dependent oxidoreductase [Archangium lipolyticum]
MSTPDSRSSTPAGGHAVVYGGSMAGLVAAGVLSRHFERVTLVERDRFEDGPQPRKGVPQGMHVHGLLTRGMNILRDVFPGFREDLEAAGSRCLDMTGDHAWYMSGIWRPRFQSGISFHAQSRPLLEWVTRKRLLALSNVRLVEGREVTGFLTSAAHSRVTGIQLRAPGGGEEETLEGELVVDASGRGSRTPQWLEALGYPRVEETRIHVDVVYASRLVRMPPGFNPGWKMLNIAPELPRERRLGSFVNIEGDRWLISMCGWLGDHPALDDAGYLEFARSLRDPYLHEVLRHTEPLSPITVFRFSHNQRRHYERMPRFPEGLALVGDASCSFNPVYGQGMTTAALQAQVLGECLRQGLGGASQRHRQRVGQLLEVPWSLATSGDLRFPEVEGTRSPVSGPLNWLGDRLHRLASHDEEALRVFLRVMHMLESPAALFSPRMVLKALTTRPDAAALKRRPEPVSVSQSRAA